MTDEQKQVHTISEMIEPSDMSDEDIEWLTEALEGCTRKCSKCGSSGPWYEICCVECGKWHAELTMMSLHWALLQRLTERVRELSQDMWPLE